MDEFVVHVAAKELRKFFFEIGEVVFEKIKWILADSFCPTVADHQLPFTF